MVAPTADLPTVPASAFTVSGTKDMPREIAGPADRGKTGYQMRVSRLRRQNTAPAVDITECITALSSRSSDYPTTVPPKACAKAWASPSSSKSTRKTVAVPSSE